MSRKARLFTNPPPTTDPTNHPLASKDKRLEVLGIEYEHPDKIVICGQRYSFEFFKQFGGLMPIGQLFRVINRGDGVVTLKRYYEKHTFRQVNTASS